MKKSVKKLTLSKVTLANLDFEAMQAVGGVRPDTRECTAKTICPARCNASELCSITLCDPGACSYGCPTRPDTQCQ